MTENEAIKEIETSLELAEMCTPNKEREKEIKAYKIAIQALEEIQQYRAIGTIEEFKALKEKKKMKPLKAYDEERESNWCSCPNCAKGIGWEYERHFNFCSECGTEFDWQ